MYRALGYGPTPPRVDFDGDSNALLDYKYIPDARLNYAQNLLRRRDDGTAIVFWGAMAVVALKVLKDRIKPEE